MEKRDFFYLVSNKLKKNSIERKKSKYLMHANFSDDSILLKSGGEIQSICKIVILEQYKVLNICGFNPFKLSPFKTPLR